MEILEIKAALQIRKPIDQVFEAIIDPAKMSNYFISKSSGLMETGKNLIWEFPEFEDSFPVRVDTIIKNDYVSFFWDGADKVETCVEIRLEARSLASTLVTVSEKSMPKTEAGIQWLKNNTAGWANFLACLKAYLEFSINLREGGFDYLMKNE